MTGFNEMFGGLSGKIIDQVKSNFTNNAIEIILSDKTSIKIQATEDGHLKFTQSQLSAGEILSNLIDTVAKREKLIVAYSQIGYDVWSENREYINAEISDCTDEIEDLKDKLLNIT